MRGLIYKEMVVFFKSIDAKLIIIAGAAVILLMFNTGIYAGLFASAMLAITVGMQNTMGFVGDEKADWKKYQMAMPVSGFLVVASKYISVILTLAVSVAGSVLFNIISSIFFGGFNIILWEMSIVLSVILPLIWTGICLPFTYWFGFRQAQLIRLVIVVPVFYLAKYMEDGPGLKVMEASGGSYMAAAIAVTAVIFVVSVIASVMGYEHRK